MTAPQTPPIASSGEADDHLGWLVQRVAEVIREDGGGWRACSGCQESVDGCVSYKDYPYSTVFQCQPGAGCGECGGIGVLWEDGDFWSGYSDMLEDVDEPTPPAASSGQDLREAMRFIAAARDFANAGNDKFHPGYSQYVDLLEAAETLVRFDAREAVLDLPFANTAPIEWGEYEWSRFKSALLSAPAVQPGGDLVGWTDQQLMDMCPWASPSGMGQIIRFCTDNGLINRDHLAPATPQPEAEEGA